MQRYRRQPAVTLQEPPIAFLIPPTNLGGSFVCVWYPSDKTQKREELLETAGFSSGARKSIAEPNQPFSLRLSIYMKLKGLGFLGIAMLFPEDFDTALLSSRLTIAAWC